MVDDEFKLSEQDKENSDSWPPQIAAPASLYTAPKDFARMHGVSDSRTRRSLAERRVFPRQKLGNGRWIMFADGAIGAPHERTNRTLRGQGWFRDETSSSPARSPRSRSWHPPS